MNKIIFSAIAAFFLAGAANAQLIDFRDAAWSGAHGQQSWTVDGVTVTSNYYSDPSNTDTLFWDAIDGFGVDSSYSGYDASDPSGTAQIDEIDQGDFFCIEFDDPTYVYGVWLTDLYAKFPPLPRSPEWTDWGGSGDGSGEAQGEGGSVSGDGYMTWVDFWGQDSDQANGEQYVPIGMTVSVLDFSNVCTNSEYSVAGVEIVPVPGAVLLGMLGLGIAGVKLRKRA